MAVGLIPGTWYGPLHSSRCDPYQSLKPEISPEECWVSNKKQKSKQNDWYIKYKLLSNIIGNPIKEKIILQIHDW